MLSASGQSLARPTPARIAPELIAPRRPAACLSLRASSDQGSSYLAPEPQQQHNTDRLLRYTGGARRLTKEDYDVLPHRIILMRHAESLGNVERHTYSIQPDHSVPLTDRGRLQAIGAGKELRSLLEAAYPPDQPYRVFIMTSPYCRTLETTDMLLDAFTEQQVVGVRQAVQLREQDFGNFQEPTKISQDLNDRNKFGRFYFRFPNGESGADVYDRLTIFEDHLTRDMLMGRFASTNLVLVTHGLTLRIFLMRWFHWSVDEFLRIYNPGNAEPVVIERLPWELVQELQSRKYAHAKHCYHITPQSQAKLQGLEANLCSYLPRQTEAESPKARWMTKRGRMAELGHYAPSPPGQSVMDTVDFKLLGAAVAAADTTTSTTSTSGSSNGSERDKGGLEVEGAESCVMWAAAVECTVPEVLP
ncbi:histidine phosphatase superfamily [Haematococcus lacustris]